jgi:hypothetical protein
MHNHRARATTLRLRRAGTDAPPRELNRSLNARPASPALHRISRAAGSDLGSLLLDKLEGLLPPAEVRSLCALVDQNEAMLEHKDQILDEMTKAKDELIKGKNELIKGKNELLKVMETNSRMERKALVLELRTHGRPPAARADRARARYA